MILDVQAPVERASREEGQGTGRGQDLTTTGGIVATYIPVVVVVVVVYRAGRVAGALLRPGNPRVIISCHHIPMLSSGIQMLVMLWMCDVVRDDGWADYLLIYVCVCVQI